MRCHWSSASSFLLLILPFFEPLSAQRGEFSLEQVKSAGSCPPGTRLGTTRNNN